MPGSGTGGDVRGRECGAEGVGDEGKEGEYGGEGNGK